MDYIKNNLKEIKENIRISCEKSNRNINDIKIIAVTKNNSVEKMKYLENLSILDFGENRVQEFLEKYNYFDENINWHIIGHLQRNKVKYIIDKIKLIHSVSNEKLAIEINKKAKEKNINMDILIQVNIAQEESKFGLKLNEVENFLEKISYLSNIHVKGLMTIAPYVLNPEDNRNYFKEMNKLFIKLKNEKENCDYLSMGMTNDYMVAIEEGANIIRIGTGFFGQRDY